MSAPLQITSAVTRSLHDVTGTRALEQLASAGLKPHTLMQRAGLSVARLALALAPHARCFWIACGPGNNGGDGFEAALRLHQFGKQVVLTCIDRPGGDGDPPVDAQTSRGRALAAGLQISLQPPTEFDFCIDALLGIGAAFDARRPATARMLQWLALMKASGKPRLAVDIPTGLGAATGRLDEAVDAPQAANTHRAHKAACARNYTLSLLTLKPGLFTASGRDCAGEVWFDDLGLDMGFAQASATTASAVPCARLLGKDYLPLPSRQLLPHASHKGSFGDVAIVGGQTTTASHMAGAALLAARAALHAGAGRVYVCLLGQGALQVDLIQPELMFRSSELLDLRRQVVVCGCGGGTAVRTVLPKILSSAVHLVLDADALNAIAADTQLQSQLKARAARGYTTVLTPHPLEAARLQAISVDELQADRLRAASTLAARFQCVVVLKGSGTIIAAPEQVPMINASGNALLATAGTGDVLAGMIGACLAHGHHGFDAACCAVSAHGGFADEWSAHRAGEVLTASRLASLLP